MVSLHLSIKKKILLITAFFLCFPVFSQPPPGISYQAVMRDAQGQLISETTIGIRISIVHGSLEGSEIYTETHNPMSNINGLVTFVVGHGTTVKGDFNAIPWSEGPFFLKTEVDTQGGTDYSISGIVQLLSVPYALHSLTSEDAFKGDMHFERITNLGEPLYINDATTKNYVDVLIDSLLTRLSALEEAVYQEEPVIVTDIDGNTYQTVKIGDQQWMTENLRVTRYNNGDPIPTGLDNSQWASASQGAMAIFPHADIDGLDSEQEVIETYGAYYNWHTIDDSRGLCPTGWHVPSESEWDRLMDHIIDSSDNTITENAANSLKSCFQVNSPLGGDCQTNEHPRWNEHDIHYGNNEFGFSATPSAGRGPGGGFGGIGNFGAWWSATPVDPQYTWMKVIYFDLGTLVSAGNLKTFGFSVRCIRDEQE